MPRINLLPVRAARRQEAAKQELMLACGAVAFAAFALFLWHGVVQAHIDDAASRQSSVQADLTDLQKKVTQIEAFKAEAAMLEKKLGIIDTLTKERFGPARLLDALADVVAGVPRVWLTQFADSDGALKLAGGAIDQEDVSAFQLGLAKQPGLFGTPKLNLINTVHEGDTVMLQWAIQCTPQGKG